MSWYNRAKGIGFLQVPDKEDVFVHLTNIITAQEGGRPLLRDGDEVEFEEGTFNGRPTALKVTLKGGVGVPLYVKEKRGGAQAAADDDHHDDDADDYLESEGADGAQSTARDRGRSVRDRAAGKSRSPTGSSSLSRTSGAAARRRRAARGRSGKPASNPPAAEKEEKEKRRARRGRAPSGRIARTPEGEELRGEGEGMAKVGEEGPKSEKSPKKERRRRRRGGGGGKQKAEGQKTE